MNLARPMGGNERANLASRAKRAAVRHMLADGIAFHEVRRVTRTGLRLMPKDVIRVRTNSEIRGS